MGVATKLVLADSSGYGELVFSGKYYDPAIEDYVYLNERGNTLSRISVPQDAFTFAWTKTNFPDTLRLPLLMKKIGEGEGIWGEYAFQMPYEGEDTVQDVVMLTLIPKESLFDHFEVKVEPDTIPHNDTDKITVTAKNENNEDYPLADNTPLYFSLGFQGERLGNLKYGATEGKTLKEIPYSIAKSGSILYIANGENPDSVYQIGVGLTGAGKERVGYAWVKPKIHKYCQNESGWKDKAYDTYKKLDKKGNIVQPEVQMTIGSTGCALTCMAMVLKTLGYDYDPLKLNNKMTEDEAFTKNKKTGVWTGGVDWTEVNALASNKIKGVRPIRIGKDSNWTKKLPLNLNVLNPHLANNSFIIALVGNPKKDGVLNNHWIIVSENKSGIYHIVDPGCYPRTTLNSYQNKIYRAIIYERK